MRDVVASLVRASAALQRGAFADALTLLEFARNAEPENAIARMLSARAAAAAGRVEEAIAHDRAALARDGELIGAHLHLAELFTRTGRLQEALAHMQAAYKPVHAYTAPHTGNGTPVRVLQLGSAIAHGLTSTDLILDPAIFETTTIAVQYWERGRPLPAHDVIFNSIADPDACPGALDAAEWLIAGADRPVINPIERIRLTGRVGTPQRLSGIDGVVAPAVALLDRDAVPAAVSSFPVLLRSPGHHNGKHFAFVEARDHLAAAIGSLPGDRLLSIAFADTRGPDGRFRKYRVMFVDGALYPAHLAISPHWNVHYFSAQMGEAEQREEAHFLNAMESALGDRAIAALHHIERRLGLEYAGIDFGLDPAGNVVVFEANAAMTVFLPEPSAEAACRRAAALRIHDAARALVCARKVTLPIRPNE